MMNISCVWKRRKQSRDHFENATEVVSFLREQSSVSQGHKYLTNKSLNTWPLTCVEDRCRHKQAQYKTSFTSVETPLCASWAHTDNITEEFQSICSSLKRYKTVIQSTYTSLRLSGYNQGRAVLFVELVVRLSWELGFILELKQNNFQWCLYLSLVRLFSVSHLSVFSPSAPQTYHSLREITDPSMWDT